MAMGRRAPPPTDFLDVGALAARTRRLVLARVASRIRVTGADADDVMQDVYVRLLVAQASPRSRYDSARGLSVDSYLHLVGTRAASNSLRAQSRRRCEEATAEPADIASDGDALGSTLMELIGELDLDEEREMATHLAAGCTLAEIRAVMDLDEEEASELRTRVRLLLLHLWRP